ncbi:hypothetical protein [Bifidobacterium callitrichidarum]|uniref:Uncharacterized protein n=1 Tax=Bifidobacterium callitrichidarum TaxID=2052941 RepID=A0A2U2MYX5_9BIFI|nr:hypothetical protein [Bifidobacterium callitrichidarum]PWG62080.1 hypothetical protein DF196_12700 [Bifidobacterium callitrichidarum]
MSNEYKNLPKLTPAQWDFLLEHRNDPETNELGYENRIYVRNQKMSDALYAVGAVKTCSYCRVKLTERGKELANQLIDIVRNGGKTPLGVRRILAARVPEVMLDDPDKEISGIALQNVDSLDRAHIEKIIKEDTVASRMLVAGLVSEEDLDLFEDETDPQVVDVLEHHHKGWVRAHSEQLFESMNPANHRLVLFYGDREDKELVHRIVEAGFCDSILWSMYVNDELELSEQEIRSMLWRGNGRFVWDFLARGNQLKPFQAKYLNDELVDHWVDEGGFEVIQALVQSKFASEYLNEQRINRILNRHIADELFAVQYGLLNDAQFDWLLENGTPRIADKLFASASTRRWSDHEIRVLMDKTGEDSCFHLIMHRLFRELGERFENPEGDVVRNLMSAALSWDKE